jgi:hypothetical protein
MEAKITYVITWEYFTLAKLEEKNVQWMNPKVGVRDTLMTKQFCGGGIRYTCQGFFFVLKRFMSNFKNANQIKQNERGTQ